MLRITAPLILVALFFSSQLALAQVKIEYTIQPDVVDMSVFVRATIEGLKPNSLPEIQIAEQFGSANDYFSDVKELKVIGHNSDSFDRVAANRWRVHLPITDGQLEYSYRIKVHQHLPNEKIRFKPSLSTTDYYSLGYALFIFPVSYGENSEPIEVERFFVNFETPDSWSIVTSLRKNQSGWVANKLDELLASTIALGRYRQYDFSLPNLTPLTIALNGSWQFSDESLANVALKIITTQINLMQTWHFPRYTVVLSQSSEKGSSGSGLVNAFEMFGHSDTKLEDFVYLISHENFHYWNGNRIRYGAPKDRWFSEGFTEYYTYVLAARARVNPLSTTLKAISKTVQGYYDNPVGTTINFEEAGRHFWEWLPEYGHLFYSKGMLIALMVDVKLRSISNSMLSLDSFMRFLDQKYFDTAQTIDSQIIQSELNQFSAIDWQSFFDRFVLGREDLTINDYARLGGMKILSQNCKKPNLGLTMTPNFCPDGQACGYKAASVTNGGPAYRAGIREDDLIAQWDPPFAQRQPANTPVRLGVDQGDGTLVWHSYIIEDKDALCQNLIFDEEAIPAAIEVRNAIWQVESN